MKKRRSFMRDVRFFILGAVPASLILALSPPLLAEEEAPPSGSVDERIERPEAERRIEALDRRVRELEKKLEPEEQSVVGKTAKGTGLDVGKELLLLASPDGDLLLRLGGHLQWDGRFYLDDAQKSATNTFLLRRARPIVEGTLFRYFDFRIMPDFGLGKSVLFDAYLEARDPSFAGVRIGKFKPPVGLELLQYDSDLIFVERALPTDLVPSRDVGVQLGGDLRRGALSYAVGLFNGVPDGGNGDGDTNNDKDAAGRIFVRPFKGSGAAPLRGLGLGVAGSYGHERGTLSSPNLPFYLTPGQQTFFSYRSDGAASGTAVAAGPLLRMAPQGNYYWGPFGLMGEYVRSSQAVSLGAAAARLVHTAWQTTASYLLTGEEASYTGVRPARPFDPRNGKWGAFELAGRYSALKVDGDAFPLFADPAQSAREAREWGAGINWYLNRNVRWMGDYDQTAFHGGKNSGDRAREKALLTRFQIVF